MIDNRSQKRMVQTLRRKNSPLMNRSKNFKPTTPPTRRATAPKPPKIPQIPLTTPPPTLRTTTTYINIWTTTPPPYCLSEDLTTYQRSKALRRKRWEMVWFMAPCDKKCRQTGCRPDCRWMEDKSEWENFKCPDRCPWLGNDNELHCYFSDPDHGGQILPAISTLLFSFLIQFL